MKGVEISGIDLAQTLTVKNEVYLVRAKILYIGLARI
jgi:hypothetical protein